MVENALARSTARAIGGDSSSSVVTNRRSSSLSLSGSLISRRAALRGVGGWTLGGLAGGIRPAGGVLRRRRGGPLGAEPRRPPEPPPRGPPPHPGPLWPPPAPRPFQGGRAGVREGRARPA